MNDVTTIARLFALTGRSAPSKGTVAEKILLAADADRLCRMIAWYLDARDALSTSRVCDGLRAIAGGYGDVLEVRRVTRGLPKSTVGICDDAHTLEIRPSSGGKWGKSVDMRVARGTRPEIDLGAAWLASVAGCLVHTDCAGNHELALACADDAA